MCVLVYWYLDMMFISVQLYVYMRTVCNACIMYTYSHSSSFAFSLDSLCIDLCMLLSEDEIKEIIIIYLCMTCMCNLFDKYSYTSTLMDVQYNNRVYNNHN